MELTGKCKVDFEKWVLSSESNDSIGFMSYNAFINYTDSLKYGVYVDFFLSKKILLEVKPSDDWNDWGFQIHLEDCMSPFFLASSRIGLDSIKESRVQAIEKANEIYNS